MAGKLQALGDQLNLQMINANTKALLAEQRRTNELLEELIQTTKSVNSTR